MENNMNQHLGFSLVCMLKCGHGSRRCHLLHICEYYTECMYCSMVRMMWSLPNTTCQFCFWTPEVIIRLACLTLQLGHISCWADCRCVSTATATSGADSKWSVVGKIDLMTICTSVPLMELELLWTGRESPVCFTTTILRWMDTCIQI